MPERGKICPECGSVLEKGSYGLICSKCGKEFYYKDMKNVQGAEHRELKCPMCANLLVESPYSPGLYVCSNGMCPTRDARDTPHTLDELRDISISLKQMDVMIKKSVQQHIERGGTPPKSWEEARDILLADYPTLAPFLIQPRPPRTDKKKEYRLALFIDELLRKGWPEQKIITYMWINKMNARLKAEGRGAATGRPELDAKMASMENEATPAKRRALERLNDFWKTNGPWAAIRHPAKLIRPGRKEKNPVNTAGISRMAFLIKDKWRGFERKSLALESVLNRILREPNLYSEEQVKNAQAFKNSIFSPGSLTIFQNSGRNEGAAIKKREGR